MDYAEAANYLLGTMNETASRRSPNRLDRMAAFLAALGDPHLTYPTVHVGGTSGKGSTSTMIAAVLSASGKRVGLHTKPHLSSMTERARIDNVPVSEERFAELLDEMMPAIEATTHEHGRPSYYETLLALAYVHFAREQVDVAVIEVGIGGKLDGTNLLEPRVSVITNVGLDHMDVLGDTVEEIAGDKVGIAREGVPLVTDASGGALAVIADGAARAGAPLVVVRDNATIEARPGEPYGQSFAVRTAQATYELSLPILGQFQRRNAATAILALERIGEDLRPSPDAVVRGFERLVIPGRMEFYPGHPGVIFDVAHNGDKAASLASALRETFPGRRFAFVIAISESKDGVAVLAPLFELPATFTFTSFETAGRTPWRPMRLVNIAERAGFAARAIVDPVEALSVARRSTDGSNLVVVTGSTIVVGQLRDWWLANVGERTPK